MKRTPQITSVAPLCAAIVIASTWSATAQNLVYSQDFETDHRLDNTWVTNFVGGANLADLYFDYSTAGVPSAPNSTGGSTHGLKMAANLDPATPVFPSGVSVSPVGFSITENFELRFDMWLNFNGPLPGGGNGSTQVGGAGYGTAGTIAQTPRTSPGLVDSVFIGATADGGSSADYRVYSPNKYVSYQDTDHIITGDPNSPFVYFAQSRNQNAPYYLTNFPGQTVPAAQHALFNQQTNSSGVPPNAPGSSQDGAQAFKWRDVSLKKIASVITYSIDGILIATADVTDAGTLGGANILFNHYDIQATVSSDPNRTNLIFTLIDNVRVTEFTNVVSVSAGTSAASETGPIAGVFTITRSAAGSPLTVNYSMSGSSTNGADYTNALGGALSGSITFAPADFSTNIIVVPVDDAIAETSETVILSITPSVTYVGAGSATVTIADNEGPQLAIRAVSTQMYERTNDYAAFQITRLGNTNAGSFNVNLSFSGTAAYGADFYTNTTVTFDPGQQSTNFMVHPVQDSAYEGNETVTVNIAASGGGEYTIGSASSASITLVDANGPAETVLFFENFDTPDSSTNWNVLFASTAALDTDYTALFGYDYSGQNIPPAPHGNGDTLGLFLTVNKDATPAAAALNLYPMGKSFSGNFALRFDMFLAMVAGGSSTEYALFGINHSGNRTNWWRSGGVPAGWTFDGIFYAVETDTGAAPSYVNYSSPTTAGNNPTALVSGMNASAFTNVFKSPPWAVPGSPAINVTNNTPVWSDVEVSKVGNIITLRINNTTIFSYSNSTAYASGNVMIGYEDAFDSIGPIQNYLVYDNVRVVRLNGLNLSSVQDVGSSVQMDFTFDLTDTPNSFQVQSASVISGPYASVPATIVQLAPGSYRATVTKSGNAQFYRIRHL